jgi:hypothetical protein
MRLGLRLEYSGPAVEKMGGRRNKGYKGRNVAFLVTLCRLGTSLARLATNTGTSRRRRTEIDVKVSKLANRTVKCRLEAGPRCLLWC